MTTTRNIREHQYQGGRYARGNAEGDRIARGTCTICKRRKAEHYPAQLMQSQEALTHKKGR